MLEASTGYLSPMALPAPPGRPGGCTAPLSGTSGSPDPFRPRPRSSDVCSAFRRRADLD